MLVAHPDSTCDVCLDPYSTDKTPYAIHCGHIFCLACLRRTEPPICPLCRASFRDYKRLIVDHIAPVTDDQARREATDLIERIALVSGPRAPTQDVNGVIVDVNDWLEAHAENPDSNPALRAAFAALQRYRELQSKREEDKRTLREYKIRLRRRDRMATADDQNTRAVEESLTTRVEQLESKLAEKDKELEYWHRTFPAYDQIPYSASLDRVDRPSDSDQDSQSTPQNSTTNNPLPPPPRPVSLAAYRRTAIPEVQPQPYLGTGSATFIPGARHEDRVIPPPELF
ncbi:hypothetical protein HETIRDRAFT_148934, partial [Heterobasidion irregulare TC 32-1]